MKMHAWRRKWVEMAARALAGAIVLTIALAAQYGLWRWLATTRLEPDSLTNRLAARLGHEQIVLQAPAASQEDSVLLFSHDGLEGAFVDANFDSAKIDRETASLFGMLGAGMPLSGKVAYFLNHHTPSGSGQPCRTSLKIWQRPIPGAAGETRLFQLGEGGGMRHRHLEMEAAGAELEAQLETLPPTNGEFNGPGCSRILSIEGREIKLQTHLPLRFQIPAGRAVRFYFRPLTQNISLWDGPDGKFQPFRMGDLVLNPGDVAGVSAWTLVIRPLGPPALAPLLSLKTPAGRSPLALSQLNLYSDQIRVGVSGTAYVGGSWLTAGDWLKLFPWLSGVLIAANTMLIIMLVRATRRFRIPMRWRRERAGVAALPATGATNVFDVFLCHNSQDKARVRELADDLRANGLRPWLDEWQLQPGLPWQVALEQQISQIRAAAVLVGNEGISPWQNMELRGFLTQFQRRQCPVIPVILPDCENPPELPPFLEQMTWVDFRQHDPDPLARLIWGITGNNPAEQPPAEKTH
ncbi:MAG: toll/interleukin-1 receptor domain-containing protein [Blastocatellia bacterium]